MLNRGADELICDLAETYHIYNYRSLPASLVATFSVGLRANSRIKTKLSDSKQPIDLILLARISDSLANLCWLNSKDGQSGKNRPKSIALALLGIEVETEYEEFETGSDFEKRWAELAEE